MLGFVTHPPTATSPFESSPIDIKAFAMMNITPPHVNVHNKRLYWALGKRKCTRPYHHSALFYLPLSYCPHHLMGSYKNAVTSPHFIRPRRHDHYNQRFLMHASLRGPFLGRIVPLACVITNPIAGQSLGPSGGHEQIWCSARQL